MLVFGFNDWTFWQDYAPPAYLGPQKVTFDGLNRLILINEGETDINFRVDVYSAWKEWVKHPLQDNAKYAEACTAVGGDPLPGSRVLGTTYFLENGWKMRTWEGSHELTVVGNVFTRDGTNLFVETIGIHRITINLQTSTLVEVPLVALSDADISAIASNTTSAVWSTTVSGSDTAINIIQDVAPRVWTQEYANSAPATAGNKLGRNLTKGQALALL
jgi:hypothetical protein